MRARNVEIFYAVYSAGSVSKAAHVLGVSQPALSKALRHTEDQLGLTLFERRAQGLVPTREADELFEAASGVFAEMEQFKAVARRLRMRADATLGVAMAPSIALSVGADVVAEFATSQPQVNLFTETLHYSEAVDAVREQRVNLAIAYEPRPRRGVRVVKLADANFVCLAPRDHWPVGKTTVSIEDFADEPLIQLSSEAPLGQLLRQKIDTDRPQQTRVIIANTYYLAQALAERGVALAIVDELAARTADLSRVRALPISGSLSFEVGAIMPEDHSLSKVESALLKAFSRHLNKRDAP